MAQKIINDIYLTNIADAIRSRKGTSNAIMTKNMANEIRNIQSSISDEFIIINGKEKIAISDVLVEANNFIHLLSPSTATELSKIAIPSRILKVEILDNNKFLVFYALDDKYGNAIGTGMACHYFEITSNKSIKTLDLIEVPCPFGKYERYKGYEDKEIIQNRYPTRIFRANNNCYFFQAWCYWVPFIINDNDHLEFGKAYKDSELTPLVLEINTPLYNKQNITSYGRYGDDWVIYNTIYGLDDPYKLWTAAVQVNNNTIQKVQYIGEPDSKPSQHDNGNIYTLDEKNGLYFMSYRENINGSYVTNFIPIKAQLVNNNLTLTFGNYNNTISGYFNSGYNGIVLPTSNSGEYCAITENCESMIILNNNNVGYNAFYNGNPMPLTPIVIQNHSGYSLYKSDNYYGIFSSFTYLNNNYFGWITGEEGTNSNSVTTYNYYLAIAELVNGTLIYRGRCELFSSTTEYNVSIKYANGYLYLADNGYNVRIYKLETDIAKIKLREPGESIDGISATEVNSHSGTIWARQ